MNTCDYLRFYTDGKWHELNVSDYKLVTLVFHDNLITSSARTISIPVAYLIRESDMVPTTVCPEFIYLPASTATMGRGLWLENQSISMYLGLMDILFVFMELNN